VTSRTGASDALHLRKGHRSSRVTSLLQGFASLSTQICALRSLLFVEAEDKPGVWFNRADKAILLVTHRVLPRPQPSEGRDTTIRLMIGADAMTTLLELKAEAEGRPMKLLFVGATEAHLLVF
jgi:hypothetical protein